MGRPNFSEQLAQAEKIAVARGRLRRYELGGELRVPPRQALELLRTLAGAHPGWRLEETYEPAHDWVILIPRSTLVEPH